MSDWLQRLNALVGEPDPCDNSDKMRRNSISSHNVTNVTGISGPYSPPYDAEGVPCGVCPTCHRGEFWRRPKFHKRPRSPRLGVLVLLPSAQRQWPL